MRTNWIIQLIILGITLLVFRYVLDRTVPALAILAGVVTFLVPTLIWVRLQRKNTD